MLRIIHIYRKIFSIYYSLILNFIRIISFNLLFSNYIELYKSCIHTRKPFKLQIMFNDIMRYFSKTHIAEENYQGGGNHHLN